MLIVYHIVNYALYGLNVCSLNCLSYSSSAFQMDPWYRCRIPGTLNSLLCTRLTALSGATLRTGASISRPSKSAYGTTLSVEAAPEACSLISEALSLRESSITHIRKLPNAAQLVGQGYAAGHTVS